MYWYKKSTLLAILIGLSACGSSGQNESNSQNGLNANPVAIVPSSLRVEENTLVTLDGSNSSDSDGNIVSFNWLQTAGQPIAVLNNSTTDTVSFTAPSVTVDTPFTFQLTVTDDQGAFDQTIVVVTVTASSTSINNSIDTQLTRVPLPGTNSATATFEFVGPQDATFECSLDSTNFSTCSSPMTLTVSEGFHNFEVRSNQSGMIDPTPAKWRWEYLSQVALATNDSPFKPYQ